MAATTWQHTSVLTEALGGGSQTAVMPASFISCALLASTLYHAGSLRCEHSQLKPCITGIASTPLCADLAGSPGLYYHGQGLREHESVGDEGNHTGECWA